MKYPELKLHINGQWRARGPATLDVQDPATEEVLGRLPVAGERDVDEAIRAANAAFPAWSRKPPLERGQILTRAAALMRERIQALAYIITRELGKPLAEARNEVITAAEMFEWAAEEGRRTYGRIIPGRIEGIRQMATLEPIGPVAAFSGWNAPAITPSRKISGALAAGCTVVIKPSEETPAIALEIVRALQDAGLPEGVVNMVFGDPAAISTQLLQSPLIRTVTFTGSIGIGRAMAERAATGLKRITLELGGHAPVLVFPDAEIDAAVDAISAAKFRNAGQICTSPTRMYVHESIYEKFRDKLVSRAASIKVGNGLDAGTQMGPMANPRRLEAMTQLTEDAMNQGAAIAAGGKRLYDKGWFWAPTVIDHFTNDCAAANTEPFGPMALLQPFSTFEQALEQANRLPFGLASYVFSQNIRIINNACAAIQSGVVCVNHCRASLPETPFGGIKESGIGREGGLEGLKEFLQVKYISQI